MLLAVSGASGKTGWRVVEEALRRGQRVRALVRRGSTLPPALAGAEEVRVDLGQADALAGALRGCDALVIATGARPSPNLAGPLQVDALGVNQQISAARAVGLRRVVLVSSLCAGRWLHPLNLFGLILLWKRVGERALEQSGLDWTVVRPGGLSEREEGLERQGIRFSGPDQQESDSIPRRLVARLCLDALDNPASVGRIIEVTSGEAVPAQDLAAWLATS
ncbi:MAG: SDR family oxidoreductase [Synechococcaceae cyanobacterium]